MDVAAERRKRFVDTAAAPRIGGDRLKSVAHASAHGKRQALIREQLVRRKFKLFAKTAAFGTRAERAVEREHARLKLSEAYPMLGAGKIL